MSRKNESITISCTLQEKVYLEALAEQYDCLWGDRPNISALIKAIAHGVIPLGDPIPQKKIQAEIDALETQIKAKRKLLK
jgi:hypothetical protein